MAKTHSFAHNTQVGLHINAAHPLGSSHMEKKRDSLNTNSLYKLVRSQ